MRVGVVLLELLLVTVHAGAMQEPLAFLRAIELPGVEGRIDHLAFDPATRRLYVAALGNNSVEVLDAGPGTHLKSLPGFREPQGIAVLPDVRSVAVANGEGDGVQLIGAEDYRIGSAIRLGDDADNVRYDPAAKRVYVGFGSGALAAIDPASAKVLAQAKLAGHPESFQLERGGPRVFVNVPTAQHVAVVDRGSMKVTATWPVTSAGANYPMALDEAHHRLFVGCRKPAKALMFDTDSGKPIDSADIVGDTDDMFFDARRNRLYVIGGEGFIDVLDTSASARLTRLTRIEGAPGARTGLIASIQDRLYLAVPHRGRQHAAIRVYDLHD